MAGGWDSNGRQTRLLGSGEPDDLVAAPPFLPEQRSLRGRCQIPTSGDRQPFQWKVRRPISPTDGADPVGRDVPGQRVRRHVRAAVGDPGSVPRDGGFVGGVPARPSSGSRYEPRHSRGSVPQVDVRVAVRVFRRQSGDGDECHAIAVSGDGVTAREAPGIALATVGAARDELVAAESSRAVTTGRYQPWCRRVNPDAPASRVGPFGRGTASFGHIWSPKGPKRRGGYRCANTRAREENRTPDLRITSALLCRLSYSGIARVPAPAATVPARRRRVGGGVASSSRSSRSILR